MTCYETPSRGALRSPYSYPADTSGVTGAAGRCRSAHDARVAATSSQIGAAAVRRAHRPTLADRAGRGGVDGGVESGCGAVEDPAVRAGRRGTGHTRPRRSTSSAGTGRPIRAATRSGSRSGFVRSSARVDEGPARSTTTAAGSAPGDQLANTTGDPRRTGAGLDDLEDPAVTRHDRPAGLVLRDVGGEDDPPGGQRAGRRRPLPHGPVDRPLERLRPPVPVGPGELAGHVGQDARLALEERPVDRPADGRDARRRSRRGRTGRRRRRWTTRGRPGRGRRRGRGRPAA